MGGFLTQTFVTQVILGLFSLPISSALGMVNFLCWEATALWQNLWKFKCEASTAFIIVIGEAAREKRNVWNQKCCDSWRSKSKASKPPGKKVGQLQYNPGRNNSLCLALLLSWWHNELHRLKWRKRTTAAGHYWFVVECFTDSGGNMKRSCLQRFTI